jgi:DNA-binding beta-propeller fold protein YncE
MSEVEYASSPEVRRAISGLDRTEDIRFSPNNRRLAIAAFSHNQIAVFDIEIGLHARRTHVALTGGVEVRSTSLDQPHGVDFIDDETIIVASRGGNVALFRLPEGTADVHTVDMVPFEIWPVGPTNFLETPGTVSVVARERGAYEVLICDTTAHMVSRHVMESGVGGRVQHDVLLRKSLLIPDGAAISPDRHWIAVSNHATHSVLVYENSTSLNPDAEPVGILRRVLAPHGLRFTSDGQRVLVADAEAPQIHVYSCQRNDWRGVRNPSATVTIMDDETFRKGHICPGMGGPKGLDIDTGSQIVAVTSHYQPLAFFQVATLLEHSTATDGSDLMADDVRFELNVMQDQHRLARTESLLTQRAEQAQSLLSQRAEQAESLLSQLIESNKTLAYVMKSRSWRITAPLRRLDELFRRRS